MHYYLYQVEPVALMTALIPPLNVLTISLMGLVWANDRDEHMKQVKGKVSHGIFPAIIVAMHSRIIQKWIQDIKSVDQLKCSCLS